MYVQITRINEDTNDLILSEREAWVSFNVAFWHLIVLGRTLDFVLFVLLLLGRKDSLITLMYDMAGNIKPQGGNTFRRNC